MMLIPDECTEEELRDIRNEQRNLRVLEQTRSYLLEPCEMPDTVIDGRRYSQRHGTMRDAMDALRPYAATYATLTRWCDELHAWFSVVSAGARVIAWRVGTDEAVIQAAI